MTITFYHMVPGPFAERCLLALKVKQLRYVEEIVDPATGGTRTSQFLALNPRATLPVLRDGDVVVRESQAIMFYLDRAYPKQSLYGATPASAGAIMQAICDQGSYIEPLLKTIIGPLVFGKGSVDAIGTVAEPLVRELHILDASLGQSRWLVKDGISAADINLYPLIDAVRNGLRSSAAAGPGAPVLNALNELTHLAHWLDQMAKVAEAPSQT
jgi:glutathione S-transferase